MTNPEDDDDIDESAIWFDRDERTADDIFNEDGYSGWINPEPKIREQEQKFKCRA